MDTIFKQLTNLINVSKHPKTAKKSLEQLQNDKEAQERLLVEMKDENEEKIRNLSIDAENKLKIRDNELQTVQDRENDFLRRIQQLTITENELRDKVDL